RQRGTAAQAGRDAAHTRAPACPATGTRCGTRTCRTHVGSAGMNAPVAILAGGTGGHIFPGLAVAQVLRDRQVPVLWIGARGRMEATLVPAQGFAFEEIDIAGIRGRGLGAMLSGPLRVLRAVWQARALLKQARPRAVISFGGYAAGPAGLAAWLPRIPLLVDEQ